jgi:dTDP-4-amino-4,6-dideoxygalactose transaminase
MFMRDEANLHIPVMIPDLPEAPMLMPWLERIDAAHWYTNFGPLVREFETSLAQNWVSEPSPPEVVSLSTGTAALELGLAALALPAGAKVLLPAFTFPATASAALRHRLCPVFADVVADTWQLTPRIARDAARYHHLGMVIPVASFGCPVDVADWDEFVTETGIPVLIDAAAGFGNQEIGMQAPVAFSFHATKPFGIGEGGALITRDSALAARVRRLSNFGFEHSVVHAAGTNAKLSEYAAAVGLAQWGRWPVQQARRRALWHTYAAALAALPGVSLQRGFKQGELPAVLVMRLRMPAQVIDSRLKQRGIQTRRWYCPPLHHHPAFAHCPRCGPDGDVLLPVTEDLAKYTLGLPWFAAMGREQCLAVVDALAASLDCNT